jgi:hypothetical protein
LPQASFGAKSKLAREMPPQIGRRNAIDWPAEAAKLKTASASTLEAQEEAEYLFRGLPQRAGLDPHSLRGFADSISVRIPPVVFVFGRNGIQQPRRVAEHGDCIYIARRTHWRSRCRQSFGR